MDEAFYRRQRELLTEVIREQDVLITTAAVPGRKAPILVTRDMVLAMQPGSVIVDIAAERGGNCEVTRPGETIVEQGVSVLGPLNIPSMVPYPRQPDVFLQCHFFRQATVQRRRAQHQSGRRNYSRNAGHARKQDSASACSGSWCRVRWAPPLPEGKTQMNKYEIAIWVFMLAAFLGFRVDSPRFASAAHAADVAHECDFRHCGGGRDLDHGREGCDSCSRARWGSSP